MGIFNKILGNTDNKVTTKTSIDWYNLTHLNQLDGIVSESRQIPVLVFKHSTRCGVSRMVLKGFESGYDYPEDAIKPYFIDLLRHREISDAIAQKFGVNHQSPQILLIKNGVSIFDTSHSDIDATVLKQKL